jgi:hypothetical protein
MKRRSLRALRAHPIASVPGRATLPSDHPLLRASEAVRRSVRQWFCVAAVLTGSVIARLEGGGGRRRRPTARLAWSANHANGWWWRCCSMRMRGGVARRGRPSGRALRTAPTFVLARVFDNAKPARGSGCLRIATKALRAVARSEDALSAVDDAEIIGAARLLPQLSRFAFRARSACGSRRSVWSDEPPVTGKDLDSPRDECSRLRLWGADDSTEHVGARGPSPKINDRPERGRDGG